MSKHKEYDNVTEVFNEDIALRKILCIHSYKICDVNEHEDRKEEANRNIIQL